MLHQRAGLRVKPPVRQLEPDQGREHLRSPVGLRPVEPARPAVPLLRVAAYRVRAAPTVGPELQVPAPAPRVQEPLARELRHEAPPLPEGQLPRTVRLLPQQGPAPAQSAHNRQRTRSSLAGSPLLGLPGPLPGLLRAELAHRRGSLNGLRVPPSTDKARSPSESDWKISSSSPAGNPFGLQTPL